MITPESSREIEEPSCIAFAVSPIMLERQCQRIEEILGRAVEAGAEVLQGGRRMEREGFFFEPTILGGVAQDNPAVQEEIFSPVLTLQSFETEDEALALADHPTYGT